MSGTLSGLPPCRHRRTNGQCLGVCVRFRPKDLRLRTCPWVPLRPQLLLAAPEPPTSRFRTLFSFQSGINLINLTTEVLILRLRSRVPSLESGPGQKLVRDTL